MSFKWIVRSATLAPAQPTYEPPQLINVLDSLEREGYEIFSIISEPANGPQDFNRARVVARMRQD